MAGYVGNWSKSQAIWRVRTLRSTNSVPVAQAHIDVLIASLHQTLEFKGVGGAIMVRIDDAWGEFVDGTGGATCIHGEGQIHRDEGDVYVPEAAHFGSIFGVPSDIYAHIAKADNIAVITPLRVILFAVLRGVIGRDGIDLHATYSFGTAIN